MKYLLDTCVISEMVSKQPNPKVLEFVDSLDPDAVYLSVITIGEIAKGIEKLPKSKRKQELHAWLAEDLLVRFDGKIIPLSADVLLEWGILNARLESIGKMLPAMDSLIAATVVVHDLILITRNVNDFENTGIEIVNPWE
ncbi:MAG: type II toxin-antitoxin system VapC family toxin [Anaerolineales bacterium]|mgnify:CR=1 FL=1|jgi:tRNA(fMet)-specific endonuclease VapC|nr:type II toxin-antitoxin system VapC family toxin [Anaerolineales bacterium]MDX9937923.1 type II toxin-antitoxin system VapC family toxin [Anaerolineales bacterium]GER79288.1 PIN domain ribonuclease, VapC toxin family [Candidatus Denitrolinea symbiosum]